MNRLSKLFMSGILAVSLAVCSGGAGMTAAITASKEGRSVIIVESQSSADGNSVRATGGMNAADTPYQDANEFGEAASVDKTLASVEKYADNAEIQKLATEVKAQWEAYQASPEGYFDSVEQMELDTMIGGKGTNNPDLVETLVENSDDSIERLASIGADLKNVEQSLYQCYSCEYAVSLS